MQQKEDALTHLYFSPKRNFYSLIMFPKYTYRQEYISPTSSSSFQARLTPLTEIHKDYSSKSRLTGTFPTRMGFPNNLKHLTFYSIPSFILILKRAYLNYIYIHLKIDFLKPVYLLKCCRRQCAYSQLKEQLKYSCDLSRL